MQGDKICRACLSENSVYFNIYETLYCFNTYQVQDKEVLVAEIYERLTGNTLNENDKNLPKNLCITCLEKLCNACEFIELCKTSELHLLTYDDDSVANTDCDEIETVKCRNVSFDSIKSSSNDNGNRLGDSDDNEDPDIELTQNLYLDDDSPKSNSSKTQYQCIKCNEFYSSVAELRKHEKTHKGQWKCSECDKVLANKYSLQHHMVLHTGKPHECIVCRKRFAVISELKRHTKLYHKSGKSYTCNQCPKRFYLKSHLTSHKLTHLKRKFEKYRDIDNNLFKTEELQYEANKPQVIKYEKSDAGAIIKESSQCQTRSMSPIRNLQFSTSTAEDQNSQSNNNNNENSPKIETSIDFYRCNKCYKKFRQKPNYLSHMRLKLNCKNDLNAKDNPQKCNYCAIISDNVFQLRKHLETHLDRDPFKCKLCEKNYKTWVTLRVHTRQTHLKKPIHRKTHLCTLCDRRFFTVKLLAEHYLVHQGIQKYKCDKCDSSFCTLYGLRQHANIHTRNALQCSECGKILANKMSLKSHMTIHFGKKYQCTICEKYFPTPGSLNRHMKCHRSERNYVCDRCSKRYTFRAHLNEHLKKIHENPSSFKCDECGNEFPHQRALKKHIRLKHYEKIIFNCDECEKTYVSKSRLKQHKQKAHGVPVITDPVPE